MFYVLVIFGIFVFAVELVYVAMLYDNDYFDPIYPSIFLAILLIMFAAVVCWLIYFVSDDRKILLPWGFLLYGISSFLIGIWVFIYILCIYEP